MRKSQICSRSRFGGARLASRAVEAPWGKPIPRSTATKGSRPSGSSVSRSRPSPQLNGMRYPINKPLAWPLENPQTRADLRKASGMTQGKADFNNNAVNHAFQRAGYAE